MPYADPERKRARGRAYYQRVKHRPDRVEYRRQYQKKRNRREMLRRLYGMTEAQFEAMLVAQSGGCAICGVAQETQQYRKFHVDHDHATGIVRGLLCSHCNQGLGHFRDDPARLEKAIRYLLDRRFGDEVQLW